MQLISVNVGHEKTIHRKDRDEKTGIFKVPTDLPVRVNRLGLEQDVIVSKKHHGGPDQAVYVYGEPDYAWWCEELGREIPHGTFGENLTIGGLESSSFNIGDSLHIGEIVLQVTAPRIPCGTFAVRMEIPNWVKKFRQAERPGLYCRVMKEGMIKVGDPVSLKRYGEETISILEMYRDYYVKDKSRETLLRHLKAPIAIRARKDIEKQLQNLASQ
jgi:MOSC domain-containing protein YiiM